MKVNRGSDENAKRGIRGNTVIPGLMHTPLVEHRLEAARAKERTDRRKLRADVMEGLLQNGRYQDRR